MAWIRRKFALDNDGCSLKKKKNESMEIYLIVKKTLFRMSTFDEVLYGRNDEKVPTSG